MPFAVFAESSQQVLDKAVAKVQNSKGVNSTFRIDASDATVTGSFKSSGAKFKLETPQATTWYDGTNMWTANQSSRQITLVRPTQGEVNEVNPFAYLSGYKGRFVTGFSKRKDENRYLVLLNPRDKKDEIKAIEVAVNKKTYLPERFIIRDRNDRVVTVYINNLNLNASNPASAFVCPVAEMKGFELVDLR